MKFGQLIEYNKIFFLKSHAENKAGRLIRDLLLLFKKSFICGKSKWPAASFQYILIGLNMAYNKNKLYETFGYWSEDMLKSDLLEQDLGIISSLHFVNVSKKFSRVILPDQISLTDCLYFLRYQSTCVLHMFVFQVVTSKNLKLTFSF